MSLLESIEIPVCVSIIDDYAFYICSSLASIEIPYSVTTLGKYAFASCPGLTEIEIPASTAQIENNPFAGCVNLESVTIEAGNTCYHIKNNCLIETATNTLISAFKNPIIPDGVVTIARDAFYGCSGLTEIEIPESVTAIHALAFCNCSALTTINFENTIGWQKNTGTTETPVWVNVEASDLYDLVKAGTELRNQSVKVVLGAHENCTVDVENRARYGEDFTFTITPNTDYKLDNVQVTVNGNKITAVNNSAYTYTITNVTEDITIVVTGVDEADRSVEIEFSNCSSSGSTYILGTVEYGEDYTFTVTADEGYYLDDSCLSFDYCEDTSYGEVTYTGDEYSRTYTIKNITGYVYCQFDAIANLYNVTTYSYLDEYTITADNKISHGSTLSFTISPQLEFAYPMVTNVNGDSLQTRFSNGTYYVDNVTSDVEIRIEMFENNVYITAGEKQFMDLFDFERPYTNYLSSIQEFMDYNTNGVLYTDEACTQVADLTKKVGYLSRLYSKPATLDKLTFTWDSSTSSYSVSASSTDISGEVVIPNKYKDSTNDGYVTTIAYNAFNNCTGLTSVRIPDYVTKIDDWAFYNCSGLTEIVIPASVNEIGYAFSGFSGLTGITVAEGNEKYHSENNCIIETATKTLISGCKNSIIPNYVTTIGNGAFDSCVGLTEIEIPASVITIGDGAFSGSGLTSITFAENCKVESFGYECFVGCGFTELIIPDSVTNIGGNTFDDCDSLTTVVIGNGAKGVYSFNYCDNLKTITIGSGVKYLQIIGCPKLETVNFVNTVGWQYLNGSTWEDVDASELSDLVKAGTELRCEII